MLCLIRLLTKDIKSLVFYCFEMVVIYVCTSVTDDWTGRSFMCHL